MLENQELPNKSKEISGQDEALHNFDEGAVTQGYQASLSEVIAMLNAALATELVCILRYMRHYYTVSGFQNGPIKAEFLKHAEEEQGHVDLLAQRIVQLNGKPDFNPATFVERSHADYDDSSNIYDMIKANLISERVAVEAYRRMIVKIGDKDPTTRHMLVGIMAMEEKHADDMRSLLH